jgi:hypothetical protein
MYVYGWYCPPPPHPLAENANLLHFHGLSERTQEFNHISKKEFLKFVLCVTGRWRAKNGSQLATGGGEGGGGGGGGGGVARKGALNIQHVTHICYRRKTRGLRKSPGYDSKILPF